MLGRDLLRNKIKCITQQSEIPNEKNNKELHMTPYEVVRAKARI